MVMTIPNSYAPIKYFQFSRLTQSATLSSNGAWHRASRTVCGCEVGVEANWTEYSQKVHATPGQAQYATIAEPALRRFAVAMLCALGVQADDAALVTDVFVQSDLRGEESHGSRLLLQVMYRIVAGRDRPGAEVVVLSERGATALLDANRNLGQVVAARAMRLAMEKARQFGVGLVGVRNGNSYTSAKYYPMLAAKEGMIGITYANSGVKRVTTHGGLRPLTGTNPVAIAAPAMTKPPFVLDMAISPAMEKVFQAYETGTQVPPGWAIDVDGNETRDAAKVLESRALLPMGISLANIWASRSNWFRCRASIAFRIC